MKDRVAVITGGASGIGEATVRLFAAEGARCVIADIQDDRGAALAAELGDVVAYHHTDVSREDDVRGAVAFAIERFGGLDVMFNNAGYVGAPGPIAQIPVDEYDRLSAVLLRGVFLGIKHAAAVMQPQRRGVILSTASIGGFRGGEGTHLYGALKAAVIQLTKSAALELAEDSVRVNAIAPGGIATPLSATVGEQVLPLSVIEKALAQFQPLRRAGMPDDIARAALWLASDDASFVTGHTLVVDGGYLAGTPWPKQAPSMTRRPDAT